MFYYLDISEPMLGIKQRHIFIRLSNGGVKCWPLTDDNPNKPAYDEWVAAGNTPEPWNPEQENN